MVVEALLGHRGYLIGHRLDLTAIDGNQRLARVELLRLARYRHHLDAVGVFGLPDYGKATLGSGGMSFGVRACSVWGSGLLSLGGRPAQFGGRPAQFGGRPAQFGGSARSVWGVGFHARIPPKYLVLTPLYDCDHSLDL